MPSSCLLPIGNKLVSLNYHAAEFTRSSPESVHSIAASSRSSGIRTCPFGEVFSDFLQGTEFGFVRRSQGIAVSQGSRLCDRCAGIFGHCSFFDRTPLGTLS